MVKLEFSVLIPANLEAVWEYFSQPQNIVQWDPNVKYVKSLQKKFKLEGSTYQIITKFGKNQYNMICSVAQYINFTKIVLIAENTQIITTFEISFERSSSSQTKLTYKSNIKQKGLGWIFTVFFLNEIDRMKCSIQKGIIEASTRKFGITI